jgi:hypothetical protein
MSDPEFRNKIGLDCERAPFRTQINQQRVMSSLDCKVMRCKSAESMILPCRSTKLSPSDGFAKQRIIHSSHVRQESARENGVIFLGPGEISPRKHGRERC